MPDLFGAHFGSLVSEKFSMSTQIERGEGILQNFGYCPNLSCLFRDGIPNTMHNIDNNEIMVL